MSRLRAALDPRSVAIIGASENYNKVGGRPVHYLDKFGFKGKVFPINPTRQEVQGHKCYPSLADLPEAPLYEAMRYGTLNVGQAPAPVSGDGIGGPVRGGCDARAPYGGGAGIRALLFADS